MTKSRPFILWLVAGIVALTLWFGWQSAKEPASGRSVTSPAEPSTVSTPPAVSGSQGPAPVRPGSTAASNAAPSPGTAPAAGTVTAAQAVDTPASGTPNPGESGLPNQVAQVDVGRVRHMIGDYHTLMGENPVGTNAEIMKQMTGGNPRQATLGPPDGIPLNPQGELVDPWGTPYFFHQLSRDKMEVRSAGPDKVMWTADDVTAR